MDELMQRLKGTGLDDGQVSNVLSELRSFLEEKLPAPLASKLDGILSGDAASLSSLTDMMSGGEQTQGLMDKAKGLLGS